MPESSFPAIVAAVDALTRKRPGIGRTHIHKFLYLAESWGVLHKTHRFSLYLHGPYSRDLDGELLALRAAGFIQASPDPGGYGSKYSVDEKYVRAALRSLGGNPNTARKLDTLAEVLAPLGVRTLEAVSTAEYVQQTQSNLSVSEHVAAVRKLKPHLTREEIETAMSTLSTLRTSVGVDQHGSER